IEPGESPAQAVLREVMEESAQHVRLNRILELQSDHWIGRAPSGKLEDFHALRIIYSATAPEPTDPIVLDVGGTTRLARWVPLPQWRRLSWGSATRSCLERHLGDVPSQ
ncbi:MAG: NUDIX domain-containing protein, partial [Cutibacterium granulosum]|nr:NUDIX domain-containing protein [Cutibacterium granulosum]